MYSTGPSWDSGGRCRWGGTAACWGGGTGADGVDEGEGAVAWARETRSGAITPGGSLAGCGAFFLRAVSARGGFSARDDTEGDGLPVARSSWRNNFELGSA